MQGWWKLGKASQGGGWKYIKSKNQIQRDIDKNLAPNDIERLDFKNLWPYEKPHIHFKTNKSALNFDGTWKHWGKNLTNKENDWLKSIW